MNLKKKYRQAMEQIAFEPEDLHRLTQNIKNASAKKESGMMQKTKTAKRTYIRPLIAAALILLLAFSVGAAVRFIVPHQMQTDLQLDPASLQQIVDLEHAAPGDVTTVQKTQKTNGLLITFEAVAQGKRCVKKSWMNEEAKTIAEDRTYAIFSIRREDGKPFYGNQDGKGWTLPYQAPNFSYNLLLQGYAPNPSALAEYHEIFIYEEGNTLYKAYDITDALPFADKQVSIVINEGQCCTSNNLRINAAGEFYYNPDYTGIRALFDLQLDPALADAHKQAEAIKTQPLHTYEEIVALCAEAGEDYDTIPAWNE